MTELRDEASSSSQEAALLASARRIVQARPAGGWACLIRLSHMAPQRLKENFSFSVNVLRSAVERCLGRLYVLGNSDIVVICWQTRRWQLRSAIASLQPLFDGEARGGKGVRDQSFAVWWDLDQQSEDFLSAVEGMAAPREGLEPGTSDPGLRKVESVAKGTHRVDPMKLATLVGRIKDANLASAIRRQPVCRLTPAGAPQPVFEEVYVSIQELQRLFAPRGELGLDRWLFRSLTEVLDERVLSWLAAAESLNLLSKFALNLNLSTLVSGDFARFEAQFGAQLRGRMIIEIDKSDLLGEISGFGQLQKRLREKGYRVCIDGLTGPDLDAIDYGKFDADFFKVIWHPDFLAPECEARIALERLIAQRSPAKIVLGHCSVADALSLGGELGISLFQGWHIDALLRGVQPPTLKLVANS
jgi:EAL domain-containing protein (putative c-di-GMP-specific phosphodiesterase class I)